MSTYALETKIKQWTAQYSGSFETEQKSRAFEKRRAEFHQLLSDQHERDGVTADRFVADRYGREALATDVVEAQALDSSSFDTSAVRTSRSGMSTPDQVARRAFTTGEQVIGSDDTGASSGEGSRQWDSARQQVDRLLEDERNLGAWMKTLEGGRLSNVELLHLQSRMYAHMQRLEVVTRAVDRIAQSIKQITTMQA
jgi:hypothetical protein